jgi:hypothetical protein
MRRLNQLIVVIIVVFFALFLIAKRYIEPDFQKVVCENILSGCGNQDFILKFLNEPKVMKPINVQLIVPNAKQVFLSFAMENMEMGLNRYQLFNKVGTNIWEAQVTLPVCVQGRSDWVVQLEIKKGKHATLYELPFKTN